MENQAKLTTHCGPMYICKDMLFSCWIMVVFETSREMFEEQFYLIFQILSMALVHYVMLPIPK